MNKFRATYLGAFIFGWLLSFGSHVAWGYYPPLQPTGSYSNHSISYSVYNPVKQQGYSASHNYPGNITVVNLQQHNGVIAWVTHDGTSYTVECVTFDPALNSFQNDWWGPFLYVSLLQVVDGVVAFNITDASGNAGARYATYDPAKEAWQKGVFPYQPVPGAVATGLYCKDGVVVYRSFGNYGTYFADSIEMKLYDPKWGQWSGESGTSLINGNFLQVYINNAMVFTRRSALDPDDFYGYESGVFTMDKTTVPFAYFVAQPKLGSSPLWVWFTDMSIAGANWSWDFGDTIFGIGRSLYHKFDSPGSFQVTQWISGPSTYSQTIMVGHPSTLKGKSVPGMLHLLLLTD